MITFATLASTLQRHGCAIYEQQTFLSMFTLKDDYDPLPDFRFSGCIVYVSDCEE